MPGRNGIHSRKLDISVAYKGITYCIFSLQNRRQFLKSIQPLSGQFFSYWPSSNALKYLEIIFQNHPFSDFFFKIFMYLKNYAFSTLIDQKDSPMVVYSEVSFFILGMTYSCFRVHTFAA